MSLTKKWIIVLLLYFPAYFIINGVVRQIFGLIPRFIPIYSISAIYIGDFIGKNLITFFFYLLVFTVFEILNNQSGTKKILFIQSKRNLIITFLVTLISYVVNKIFIAFIGRLLVAIIPLDFLYILIYFVLQSALWIFAFVVIYSMTTETPTPLFRCIRQMFCDKRGFLSLGIIMIAIIFYSLRRASWQNNISMTGSFLDMVAMLSPTDYSLNLFRWVNLGCIVAISPIFTSSQSE